MSPLYLIPVFHLHRPPGTPEDDLKTYAKQVCGPLLVLLKRHTSLRAGLHVSGWLLAWLARRHSAWLRGMKELVTAGRVEILGGGWTAPFLCGLPEVDAAGQLQWQSRWIERWLGSRPSGVWLAARAWDPSLPRILARAGHDYTFVDEGAFVGAGRSPGDNWGHFTTERAGLRVVVFPAMAGLARPLAGEDPRGLLRETLEARAAAGVSCVTWTLELDEALDKARLKGLARCLSMLEKHDHWIKTLTPADALERVPSRGRVFLPSWLPRESTDWVRPLAPDGLHSGPAPELGWEAFSQRYDEVNRLHKRMLHVSRELSRLRASLARGGRGANGSQKQMEAVAVRLYHAQAADFYGAGATPGFYDPQLRAFAYTELVGAERRVRELMDEPKRFSWQRMDFDADGEEEILVRSGHLLALVAPTRGGTLQELDFWDLTGNALDVMTRRTEACHAPLMERSRLPALVDEQDAGGVLAWDIEDSDEDEDELPRESEEEIERKANLAARLHLDRGIRASFLDRFLGEPLTLESLTRSTFPEEGDFADGRYRVLSLEQHDLLDACVISLSREGEMRLGREAKGVQVVKRFIFHRDMASFDVRYEVTNRYHTPIEAHFAVELNLGLGAPPKGGWVLADCDGRSTVAPLDEPGEAEGVHKVAAVLRVGTAITIHSSQPARCFHYPLETITPAGSGGAMQARYQGLCVILAWPLRLWGAERLELDLTLGFEGGQ